MVLRSGAHTRPGGAGSVGGGCRADCTYLFRKAIPTAGDSGRQDPEHTCYCISSYTLISPQGQASTFYSLFIFFSPASGRVSGVSFSLYLLGYSKMTEQSVRTGLYIKGESLAHATYSPELRQVSGSADPKLTNDCRGRFCPCAPLFYPQNLASHMIAASSN